MTTKTLGKLIALSLITSTVLHATNGDNLIALGTKARGMGGTAIAISHGAESGLANPALITSVESTEITFGGTIFMPEIKTTLSGFSDGEITSEADLNMIPEVSIAHKIDDNWYIGVGMWGTAGMGTDYQNNEQNMTIQQAGNFKMLTNLQIMQFGVPIAYKTEGLSLAVTPIVQYGNLDINYVLPAGFAGPDEMTVGAGLVQDFGFGYNLGLAYDFSNGLTLGATYKSSIEMNYGPQITKAIGAFGEFGVTLPVTDKLEQPEEYGIGLSYAMGQHTFAFDYKRINWSSTKGYGDFGWEDSKVYALGYQYIENEWTVRLGYNRADSAVVEAPNGGTTQNDAAINFFNLLGFPANAEEHYTIGGTYEVTKSFSVDLAYVYSPSTTDTFDVGGLFGNGTSVNTEHKETSVSFQLAYKF